jgi:hypothetical protein
MVYESYTAWVYDQFSELLKAANDDVGASEAPLVAAILTAGLVVAEALGGQLDT